MKKILFLIATLMLFIIPSISLAAVSVKGHYKKNGTYVAPHYRSNPDSNPYNNYSYPGNTNPYTGKVAPGNTDTYLYNYYNPNKATSSGTYYKNIDPVQPVYTAPVLLTKNVSYVVKTWVELNPTASCSESVFLRSKERVECATYKMLKDSYKWNTTTAEFDGMHYTYNAETGGTSSCPDGNAFLYSAATGKITGCRVEN